MRRLLFFVCFLVWRASCHALPLGNPSDPTLYCYGMFSCKETPMPHHSRWCDDLNWRFGFYGDYVFDRNLEVDLPGKPRIKKTEVFTNAGYLALNYRNKIDLFLTLGTSQINFLFDQSLFQLAAAQVDIATQTDFSWSIGLRSVLARWYDFTLGIEGQYMRYHSHIASFVIAGVEVILPIINDINGSYEEWQTGVGLAYHCDIAACGMTALIPYVGYKYSRATFVFPPESFSASSFSISGTAKFQNAKNYGSYAVGLTLIGCSKASVSVEARYVDEVAFHVNSQFRF